MHLQEARPSLLATANTVLQLPVRSSCARPPDSSFGCRLYRNEQFQRRPGVAAGDAMLINRTHLCHGQMTSCSVPDPSINNWRRWSRQMATRRSKMTNTHEMCTVCETPHLCSLNY
ncbi:hypothetical protein Nepgr_031405 [Nepenthes gracilis]|uniref:Uncharacterized protein n=1 Tax=Nepenthes gracilis TaxID=150966 RepID=A0AAD3Y4S1_NEPGR|nr:hypothetical protein Nepgr_031405 [Nepenthes gracilis]